MNLLKRAQEIIKALTGDKVYANCPCCEEPIRLSEANLFYLDNFSKVGSELYQAKLTEIRERKKYLRTRPKSVSVKSEIGARFVNIGAILERIAPSLSSFRFNRNDCRSLFDPIDYLIFEGLSNAGKVNRIIFAEIKTGKARLNARQQEIKSVVENKKIDFCTYEEGAIDEARDS